MTHSSENGIQLINRFSGCENCHTGFQFDTYLEGCTHDCLYCYAKKSGEDSNKWNNPSPKPVDLTYLWYQLYLTFEEKSSNHFLNIFLEKKVPIRIGSLSDAFIPIERRLKITYELIKILNYYHYPYLFVTRSSLISKEEYLEILDPKLASVHISIPSLDEEKTRSLEPGAPSPRERLQTLKILKSNNIWVTARINPLFPSFSDEYLTLGNRWDEDRAEFKFFSLDLISEIAKTGCTSILAGFVTLDKGTLDEVSRLLKFPFRTLMTNSVGTEAFKFGQEEIRKYYVLISEQCKKYGIDFSTCYLGQNDEQFYSNQDLWSNTKDCCNSVDKVEGHKSTMLSISRFKYIDSDQSKGFIHRLVLKFLSYLLKKISS